ncbi:MAG: sensor histidine kinase, partial [Bacteroidota bacterium]
LQQRFLRSQLNPHFISNSLTAIQNFLASNKGDVGDYLGMFGTLMRQILENSREEFITLEEEISMLEKYFKLQKLRFGDRFEYAIEVDDTLEGDLVKIPPMFAQPFIENSLEHGLFRKEGKNEITLRFTSLGKNLIRLEINDSGAGVLTDTKLKVADHTSLSTKITHERLDLMKVVHKQHAGFESENIVSDQGEVIGYKVSITLPGKGMVA